jgi:hypothetical protein
VALALLFACSAGYAALDNAFYPEQGEVWSDLLCVGQEIPKAGDFNGDGKTDIAIFVRDAKPEPGRGDVGVALSDGRRFLPIQQWHDLLCVGQEVPVIGDFNGDGKDDVAVFVKDTKTGPDRGCVGVSLSEGDHFGPLTKWIDHFCTGDQIPLAGDFNGDGRDDIICFVRESPEAALGKGPLPTVPIGQKVPIGENVIVGGAAEAAATPARPQQRGDVYVALSGKGSFLPAELWTPGFCYFDAIPMVADFNGDGKDDIITFARGESGLAWVALSNGHGFDQAAPWADRVCLGQEVPGVGQFNDDREADVISFVRSSRAGAEAGDVYVALAEMLPPPMHFSRPVKRHDWFGIGDEVQVVGDFDGDHKDDLATFTRTGRCYVVHSGFGRPVFWMINMPRFLLRSRSEVSGDEPYFAIIDFRSRFSTAGSTQVYWVGGRASLREICNNIDSGTEVGIPRDMGTAGFENATLFTIPDGIHMRSNPEVVGAVVICLEHDNSPWSEVVTLVNRVKDQALRPALDRLVANRPIAIPGAIQDLVNSAQGAVGEINSAVRSSLLDAMQTVFVSPHEWDNDDLVDYHVFLYLAVDEEWQQYLGAPPAPLANVTFGRLAEAHYRYSRNPAENHPISFHGGVLDSNADGGNLDADVDVMPIPPEVAPPAVEVR